MTNLEDRVRELEGRQATLMAQMDEARRQITVLGTLPVQFAELATSVLGLKEDIGEITKTLTSRDKQASEERRSVRVALIGLTGVILAAVIAAVGAIIVTRLGGTPAP